MMPGQPSGYGPYPVINQQPMMENPPMYPGPPQYAGQVPMPMPMAMPMAAPYSMGPSAPPVGGWPQPNMTSPRGLEYLIPLDKIFIDQKVEGWEVFTNVHCENRYAITDVNGQPLYSVQENSDCFERMCCGSNRSFKMNIYERSGNEVLRIERPFTFFGDECTVFSGNEKLGYIRKKIISCTPAFTIYDAWHKKVFRISGPLCFCGCEHEFTIYSMGGDEVGEIKKRFSGIARELFTNADKFSATFPLDLDVKVKALILATTILVDFVYFERNNN